MSAVDKDRERLVKRMKDHHDEGWEGCFFATYIEDEKAFSNIRL
jgi:hypothetical protein